MLAKTNKRTRELVQIALMTALTVALSFVKVPFYPVPFTLQTLAAMLAGVLLNRLSAIISQVLYVFIGLLGLPIFSQGGGFGYIFNPTFGYILFLPILTLLVSILHKKLKVFGLILPSILLLFFGAFYYILVYRIPINSDILKIIWTFSIIFIPAEILKAFSANFIANRLNKIRPYVN